MGMNEMEWLKENIHSLLSPQNHKFLFPPKLGGVGGNEFKFNENFIKISKISLYIQLFILK